VSIRYKTALVFLATGLIPFLAVGTLVFLDFQTALSNSAFRHLETVTNLQGARVSDLIATYSQAAVYIGEQAPIRQAVQMLHGNPNATDQLHQVLMATQSVGSYGAAALFQEVTLTDPSGKVLDSTSTKRSGQTLPTTTGTLLADMYRDDEGVHLLFGAPILSGDTVLARLYIAVDGQALFTIASNRDGLGETGETFLVKPLNNEEGVFVTPLRFDSSAAFSRTVPLADTDRPSVQAILKKDQTLTTGAVGYRGQPVVAVTRYLPQVGLGIVGQIDQVEVFNPVEQLAVQVVVFAALLILLTIFVSSFMAELFVKPLLYLATAAGKLRKGDFSARAKVWSSDEIGQLGHTFNVMAEDLAKQDRAKSDIIALISHQLRTPVTAIKGFVSLVLQNKKHPVSADNVTMLELAFQENEKLNKLITQILEIAYVDANKLVLNKVETDLNELVAAAVADQQPAYKLRQQTITFAPFPEPLMSVVDQDKLAVVVDILLSNASKYSAKKRLVHVALGRGKGRVWIRVTDSGLGMSRTDQHKLFQKFSRIENPKREVADGVGLGLYMAKKIVDLHKGDIVVQSKEGQGSSFIIELPIK
jgi:signal transduction histidine kinase